MTDLTAIGNLIDKLRSYALERSQRPFDYIAALGLTGKELPHSNFIATLLNPHGSHGLGDSLLLALLAEIRRAFPEQGLIDTISLDSVDIQREQSCVVSRPGVGEENQRIDSTRFIDIVVRIDGNWLGMNTVAQEFKGCKGIALLIENKVWTQDSANQLSDYWKWGKDEYPDHHLIGIYLSPHARNPRDEKHHNFKILGYANIIEALDIALEESHPTPSVYHALQSYKWHMKDNLVMQDSELQILAQEIYAEFGEIMEEIIRRKKTVFELAVEVLKEKLNIGPGGDGADSTYDYIQTRCSKSIFNFRPASVADAIQSKSSWEGAWEKMEVQFELLGENITVVVRKDTSADKVDEMRKKVEKSGVTVASNIRASKWPRLYSERLYGANDMKNAKPEDVRAAVEQWLKNGVDVLDKLNTHLFAPAAWPKEEYRKSEG